MTSQLMSQKCTENLVLLTASNITVFNISTTRLFPCCNIHCYCVGLVGNSNHQKVDTSRHFSLVGLSSKPATHFVAFTLVDFQHTKAFPKQFRLHSTTTRLDLPPPSFWRKFHFIGSIFNTTKAAKTGIIKIKVYQRVYMCLHKCLQLNLSCFPRI